ncbi:1,2-phenylacetyl-CoA epoxidase subunit PaaC [Streptomyces humi]
MTTAADAHPPVRRDETDADLARHLLGLGDDALILCQRLCQWITRAPTVEEDLALSNIALDLLGHARTLLTWSGRLDGTGRDEDALAYGRRDREFTNVLLAELPNGDWAVTVARQLVYSHYAELYYGALAGCGDARLSAFGARAVREVGFHRLHADRWTTTLGLGTPVSARRMQAALDQVWPYAFELFAPDEVAVRLGTRDQALSAVPLRDRWERRLTEVLTGAGLTVPEPRWRASGGRAGLHTEEFGPLIAELQSVRREFPGGVW